MLSLPRKLLHHNNHQQSSTANRIRYTCRHTTMHILTIPTIHTTTTGLPTSGVLGSGSASDSVSETASAMVASFTMVTSMVSVGFTADSTAAGYALRTHRQLVRVARDWRAGVGQ